ncbi:MAG: protein translocase subunit SecF [Candidatus Sungbacteria bacterium]|nr:protein translocase subunit SecF [Candidatus Sungbacteria bacterium]
MNIIGHKYIYLAISGLLVLGGIAAFMIWGLKEGIDFTGGSLLEVEFQGSGISQPDPYKIKQTLDGLDLGTVIVQSAGTPTSAGGNAILLRFKTVDESMHQQILARLKSAVPDAGAVVEKRFDTIGPTIGAELRQRSMLAIVLAIIAIVLYIAWAFRRVSKPLPSWKYGIVAIATLVHDLVIPTGLFAVLGHLYGVEVDSLFITALLTIMGFSIHDTIVVFDRTRENLRKTKDGDSYESIVNRSVNETLARSINTSLTVLLVLGAIFFFGGATVHYFSLALAVGIIFGTYSSIFVASPLLVIWNNLSRPKSG